MLMCCISDQFHFCAAICLVNAPFTGGSRKQAWCSLSWRPGSWLKTPEQQALRIDTTDDRPGHSLGEELSTLVVEVRETWIEDASCSSTLALVEMFVSCSTIQNKSAW